MMINVDTPLDRRGVTRMVVETEGETITVKKPARPTAERSFLGKPESVWGWREVRDYVVDQIERRTGPFTRVMAKEQAIFQRFCRDWGERAGAIAKFAFEIEDGMWRGQPIEIGRFSKGSDPYFAQPISERLVSTSLVKDW